MLDQQQWIDNLTNHCQDKDLDSLLKSRSAFIFLSKTIKLFPKSIFEEQIVAIQTIIEEKIGLENLHKLNTYILFI